METSLGKTSILSGDKSSYGCAIYKPKTEGKNYTLNEFNSQLLTT